MIPICILNLATVNVITVIAGMFLIMKYGIGSVSFSKIDLIFPVFMLIFTLSIGITALPPEMHEEFEIVPENGVLIGVTEMNGQSQYLLNKKISEDTYETIKVPFDSCTKHRISAYETPYAVVDHIEYPSMFPLFLRAEYNVYVPQSGNNTTHYYNISG